MGQRKGEKNVGWQPETQPKGKPPVEKTKGAETMQRLIDADALKEYVGRVQLNSREKIFNLIDAQPTIDAEPQWIPCSERMPEEPFGCLVTVWDTDPVTMDEFENVLPYFVGWDGEQWNDADGEQCPFEVLAWMPLPRHYEVEE